MSACSELSSRANQWSGFSWNFSCESGFLVFVLLWIPSSYTLLLLTCFLSSGQRFQAAGVELDHEALQNIIRFLLLTFRQVFIYLHTFILFIQAVRQWNDTIYVSRSAGKNNLSADGLLLKLEASSNRWSKASLQVLHGLWSEHGVLVHAQQEAQSMLSISRVHLCKTCMYVWDEPNSHLVGFCCRLWTCSGSWGWQWAQTRVGPWTHRM